MTTICLQCAMKAMVEHKLQLPAEPVVFDETMAEHIARVHPDLEATRRERQQLEADLRALLDARTIGGAR